MTKYYHSSLKLREGEDATLIKCGDYYEKINEYVGCPEGKFPSGFFIGFPHSDIPEICFSKSMEASVIAVVQDCEKDTIVFIYETEEAPDIDISDCEFDFRFLEEVRYRRDVKVRLAAYIKVPLKIINKINKIYENCECEYGYVVDSCIEELGEPIKKKLRSILQETKGKPNFFWKSKNSWRMPSKNLNLDYNDFRPYKWYLIHQPNIAKIIYTTLKEENKAERFYFEMYYFFLTKTKPKFLPSTFLEIYWEQRPTLTELEWYWDQVKKVNTLAKNILEQGYDQTKPIWCVDALYEYRDEVPARYIVLDGGHHRLQAVRQLIYKKQLLETFEIPVLVSSKLK